MTKAMILSIARLNGKVAVSDLNKFLEANVCIPKGVDRHPYAEEVLHHWIEGTPCEYYSRNTKRWIVLVFGSSCPTDLEYRIKPSEPVYEYQYIINGKVNSLDYWSESEFWDVHSSIDDIAALKINETKRLRK